MSTNTKALLVALVPNTMFVCALFGWTAGRLSVGQSSFPDGWTSAAGALIATLPMVSVAAGNAVRMAARRPG